MNGHLACLFLLTVHSIPADRVKKLELISHCKMILKQEQQEGVAYGDLNSHEETGEEIWKIL
jgi:hypothetical protein